MEISSFLDIKKAVLKLEEDTKSLIKVSKLVALLRLSTDLLDNIKAKNKLLHQINPEKENILMDIRTRLRALPRAHKSLTMTDLDTLAESLKNFVFDLVDSTSKIDALVAREVFLMLVRANVMLTVVPGEWKAGLRAAIDTLWKFRSKGASSAKDQSRLYGELEMAVKTLDEAYDQISIEGLRSGLKMSEHEIAALIKILKRGEPDQVWARFLKPGKLKEILEASSIKISLEPG